MQPVTIDIPFSSLPIDRAGCIAELGYAGACPEFVLSAIDEAVAEVAALAHGRAGWILFGTEVYTRDRLGFSLGPVTLVPSDPVMQHAAGTVSLAVLVATAGPGIETTARDLIANGDPLKGFIMDWFGSQVADLAAKQACESIRTAVAAKGWKATPLFSPGTCGWDIVDQQNLFKLFPPGFLGITLTESSLMQPIKSVSGVIGLGPDVDDSLDLCSVCGFEKCHNRAGR